MFLGVLDDNTQNHGMLVHDYEVLGGIDWLYANPGVEVVVAIGNPVIKRKIIAEIKNGVKDVRFATLIEPNALIGDYVSIGEGSIICAGTIVTTDIKIGNHVTINLDCTIGHDAIIEDYCTIAPSVNVSGNVLVKEGTDIGTGSTIIQGVNIGEWSIIGAGAVVIREVPTNTTSVGNPSRVIKEREAKLQLIN